MSFVTLRGGFLNIVWPLVLGFNDHHIDKKSSKKTFFIEGKVKPGLALTGFRTILPCFQQVNLTRARDPIENQHLVSDQLQKNTRP